ncbi:MULTISPECIES: YbjN domain-containing protein [Sphingomonas]|uniref:YbjN domain-containing protein n=1 Tax=Sphingomonas TaxID=13687 RepID=UPI00082A4F7A|nr:YbjN domain-containing protein [Sphingomonas sp. CCH10-B3]
MSEGTAMMWMWRTMLVLVAGLAVLAAPARAQDVLLDLSTAEQVQVAVQEAGYKAELKKNDDGSLYILSAANGEGFTIDLTDCKALKCDGLSFQAYYKPEPIFTPAFANQWNQEKRFLKVSINSRGELRLWFDVSTRGKLTKTNFADLIDWYVTMDNELAKFVQQARGDTKSAK